MSIFAKKPEPEPRPMMSVPMGNVPPTPGPTNFGRPNGYGISEAIQLMRTIPVEQNPDLVVRVVRATLASLNVRLPDIIEDASRKQKATQDRIAAVHGQIAELEKQLDAHRREIASLETDLKETTNVKERLQLAEKSAGANIQAPTPTPHAPPPVPGATASMGSSAVTPPFGQPVASKPTAPAKPVDIPIDTVMSKD
jgi:hypothetical protein